MKEMLFLEDDNVLYEDERVAFELGNGQQGATIYVIQKLPDNGGSRVCKYPVKDLVTREQAS